MQNKRVRKIIRFASLNVPYYRELFRDRRFRPEDFQTAEDLCRLPVISPMRVRKNANLFRPDRVSLDSVKIGSSGTTGVPRGVHHDAVSILRNSAHMERSRFFFSSIKRKGRNFRESHLVPPLGAASQDVRQYIAKKTMLPKRTRAERSYISMLENMEDVVGTLNKFKPDVIRAYGSGLDMLFESLFTSGSELALPSVVVYSADGMAPSIKRRVMDELGVKVFSEYNCVECLQIGFECEEHNGYHLHEDCYAVRIVDDEYNTLPDGSIGRVIVSNLINRANVLLNYELGDEAAMNPGQCKCGRNLRMLGLNVSRVADRLTLEDGTQVHPIIFAEAVYKERDLWHHQVLQRSKDEFDIKLVVDPTADKDAMKKRLTSEFDSWFQGKLRFYFQFVDQIGITSGGKRRAVIFNDSEE